MRQTRRAWVMAFALIAAQAQNYKGFGDAMRQGKEFLMAGKADEAFQAFSFAFSRAQTDQESALATAHMGRALTKLNRTREAIEYMERSSEFYHYDQVEEELKSLRVLYQSTIQSTDEIRRALSDQQASNRGTRPMPRRPLALRVNFDFDQATLTQEGRTAVASLGLALADFQNERIKIVGHTDLIGDPTYNQGLSERRAATVAAEISRRFRFPRKRLVTSGMGMRQPVYNSTSDEDSLVNRRVEVTILKPGEF